MPSLMYSLPKGLTAATGMDAMTHAIEGLITKAAWELSDMFEIKAIQMIHKYLPIAVEDPKNPEGRNGMAVAQYVAGMAFSNVGLGVDHGMAHPMSALHDVPHGVACAILLPTVMRFNAPAALDKYVDIAKALDVYRDGMTKEEAADAACTEIENLEPPGGHPRSSVRGGHHRERYRRAGRPGHRGRMYAGQPPRGNPRRHSSPLQEDTVTSGYHSVITERGHGHGCVRAYSV